MKCLKIYYQKIKFNFKFLKLILSKNYFRNFYLFREYNSKSTDIIKDLRELLKLKPYWSQGHYLLGILSFLEYRNSKDAHYLGSLNMSKIALNELRSNNNKTNFLNLLLKFLNKKFEDIINDKSINKLMSN